MTAQRDVFREAAHETAGPVQIAPPEVTRVGLGYVVDFTRLNIQMKLGYVKTRSGEMSGELTVITQPRAIGGALGHLFQGRFNLSSLTARTTAAKYLKSRWPADWESMLEQFCLGVLRLEREGEPWHDLETDSFPVEMTKLVDPIVPLNVPTVLFAPFSAGKSTLAAAIALSVSLGVEVVPGWKPLSGPVAILDWEDQPKPWQDRLRCLARGAGETRLGKIRYRTCYRPLADDLEGIARYLDEMGAALVVVDSVGLASGTSDGPAEESALRLFSALRALGRTSLLIDQVSGETLQNGKPAAKSYGSIYKMYIGRSVYELKREKEPQDGRAEVLMINTKVNHGAKRKPLGLVYEYGEGTIRIRPGDVDATDLQEAMPQHTRIVRLLTLNGPMTVPAIAEETSATEAAVRSVLSRHKDKLFTRFGNGSWAAIVRRSHLNA